MDITLKTLRADLEILGGGGTSTYGCRPLVQDRSLADAGKCQQYNRVHHHGTR